MTSYKPPTAELLRATTIEGTSDIKEGMAAVCMRIRRSSRTESRALDRQRELAPKIILEASSTAGLLRSNSSGRFFEERQSIPVKFDAESGSLWDANPSFAECDFVHDELLSQP